jgi:threonine aldolase
MARLMAERLADIPAVKVMFEPQANAVFAELPPHVALALRNKGWKFYQFIGSGGCRLMCAWDTLPETVEQFTAEIRALCAGH